MIALLRNTGGKDLENVIAHSQPSYSRPGRSAVSSNVAFNSDYGSSGPSFFERLFGQPSPPAYIPRRQRRLFTR
jgi:hypothetical protein